MTNTHNDIICHRTIHIQRDGVSPCLKYTDRSGNPCPYKAHADYFIGTDRANITWGFAFTTHGKRHAKTEQMRIAARHDMKISELDAIMCFWTKDFIERMYNNEKQPKHGAFTFDYHDNPTIVVLGGVAIVTIYDDAVCERLLEDIRHATG